MIRSLFRVVAVVLSVSVSGANFVSEPTQESTTKLVEIEGLKPSYYSCQHVDLSIRNVSNQDLYVEAYIENLVAGSWDNDAYPYAINDPSSLYSKMVKANRIGRGAALPLSYDRCRKPRFVKEDERLFKERIRRSDKTAEDAGTPRLQRIRIEIHFDDPNAKVVKTWSQQFNRLAGKKSAAK